MNSITLFSLNRLRLLEKQLTCYNEINVTEKLNIYSMFQESYQDPNDRLQFSGDRYVIFAANIASAGLSHQLVKDQRINVTPIRALYHLRAWRLSGRWPDGGRRSTVARWTRRRAASASATIRDPNNARRSLHALNFTEPFSETSRIGFFLVVGSSCLFYEMVRHFFTTLLEIT